MGVNIEVLRTKIISKLMHNKQVGEVCIHRKNQFIS